MLIELPIVLIIIGLVGGLFFIAGSSVSPINKHLKTHIRFLEGKVNRYKQDEKEAKIENKDGIDEFIDSNPMVKTIVQSLGGKEKAMEWVLGKVGDLTNKKAGSSPPGSTEWR
jgi:hypothetical protein